MIPSMRSVLAVLVISLLFFACLATQGCNAQPAPTPSEQCGTVGDAWVCGRRLQCYQAWASWRLLRPVLGRVVPYRVWLEVEPCGIIAGSFYQHNPAFLGPSRYWRGVLMLHDVRESNPNHFDVMEVSLEFLRRKYG